MNNEITDAIAAKIHAAMVWAANQAGPPQKWQGGNSFAEGHARSTAREIEAALAASPRNDGWQLLHELHKAMADVMEQRREAITPAQRERAAGAIAVWRKVETFLAALPTPNDTPEERK